MLRFLSAYKYYFYRYLGNIKRMFGFLKTKDLCMQFSGYIGEYSYGYPEIFPFKDRIVKIGKFCSFANDVKIFLGHEHHIEWMSSYPFSHFGDFKTNIDSYGLSKGDVIIGNDVWIGYGAVILSGVTVGNGAVIAAGSVVVKDVEPYSIVGGVPAKHIRFRFSDETIIRLQKSKWWNWPKDRIEKNLDLICSQEFIKLLK